MEVPVVVGTLDLYIAEINRYPILTAEEEFSLAVRLKKFNDIWCQTVRPRPGGEYRSHARGQEI